MDLSKANDSLPHDLTVAKLEAYVLDKKSSHLVSDYLSLQKQRTKIGSTYTDWADVIRGIPPGSLLCPLLFDDTFVVNEKSDICNFSDDDL